MYPLNIYIFVMLTFLKLNLTINFLKRVKLLSFTRVAVHEYFMLNIMIFILYFTSINNLKSIKLFKIKKYKYKKFIKIQKKVINVHVNCHAGYHI